MQALGQLQIAQYFGHNAIRTSAPTRDLRDCLVLAEVADCGSLVLIPVDYAVDIDRRDAPALPCVRIGLIQIGQRIIIFIKFERIYEQTCKLFFSIGSICAVNGGWPIVIQTLLADLGHIGNEAS